MSLYLLNDVMEDAGFGAEDVDKAKTAAKEGDVEAQYHLALMFDTGTGVERNPKEAEFWYKKAAEQNHGLAAYYLARMYDIETSGIERNKQEAIKYYKIAADNGNSMALEKVAN